MTELRSVEQEYILVIEDDRAIQDVLQVIFAEEGWQMVGATDGPTGLDQAREHEPSLVILDMNVPLLPGELVAQELHLLYNGIPILVVTANAQIREDARRARAFGYIKKPFSLNALIAAVNAGFTRGRGTAPCSLQEFA